MAVRASTADRLWAKVAFIPFHECWEWQGALSGVGYGQLRVNGRLVQAHRLTYELSVGPIPDGLHLDHLCRNRTCVRPERLEPVTQAENNRRASEAQTSCINGHEYTVSNTRRDRLGYRWCRTCQDARNKARKVR